MKKKIMNNLSLKILAFLSAVILWLIVVNINDPIDTNRYTGVQVELINTDAITDDGKTYEILDGTDTIDITVTAKKSVLKSISKDNIHATADMSELTFMNTVGINVSVDKLSNEIDTIKSDTVNLKLNIEDIAKKQLFITVTTSGDPADGYIIGDVTADQNVVRLSGPQSIIESIASAEAVADVSGMNSDIGTSAEIKLYDENGKQITSTSITKNINAVNVNVEILGTKTVPLTYEVMGTPVNGYALTGEIASTPEEVTIAGSSSALNAISTLEIPEAALNVTGQSSDMTVIVDITKYLPDGVILADNTFSGKATVIVYIEKETTASGHINAKSISITNIPTGLDVEVLDMSESVLLTLVGLPEDIDTIDTDSLTGTINMLTVKEELELDEFTAGSYYTVNVSLNVPDSVRTTEDFTVRIYVSDKNNDEE